MSISFLRNPSLTSLVIKKVVAYNVSIDLDCEVKTLGGRITLYQGKIRDIPKTFICFQAEICVALPSPAVAPYDTQSNVIRIIET